MGKFCFNQEDQKKFQRQEDLDLSRASGLSRVVPRRRGEWKSDSIRN
jgi:hypothetical protein